MKKIDEALKMALKAACLIPLTKGKFALVDPENYEMLMQWQWHYISGGYAVRKPKESIYMHRIIMKTPIGMDTDHINGDKLDNRKSNLRIVTRSQNRMNQHKPRKNKYKGVSFSEKENKWQASLGTRDNRIWAGYHDTQEEAARAYNAAAKQHFGEFAKLNDVRESA